MATDLTSFYRNTAGSFTTTSKILINSIVICNTSASQQTYSITLNSIALTSSAIIPANDTVVLDIKQVVPTGQVVSFSGVSCAFHCSGVAVT